MKIDKFSWKKTILSIGSTIKDAIKSLTDSGLRIILVVDSENKFVGTISDGDIRKALLEGLTLDSPINGIINRKAITVSSISDNKNAYKLMTSHKILQVPVVDNNNIIQGMFFWDEISSPPSLDNIFVIMAGGQGMRLRPITEKCPKPLIEVAGKPIIQHIIERARSEGFHKFYISINYLGEMIEDFFQDGSMFDVDIKYLRETSPLGTAGALSLLDSISQDPIIVSNGDVITDIKYLEMLDFHIRHEALATMAVRNFDMQNPYGVVITDGISITSIDEKPIVSSNVNAGIYVLSPELINKMKFNTYLDMPEIIKDLCKTPNRAIAYPMHEPWLDIGRPDDLRKASRTLNEKALHSDQ